MITFEGLGGPIADAALASVPWPAGHQPGDIGIVLAETANQVITLGKGIFTPIAGQGVGTAGAVTSTRITAFWGRATSFAETNIDLSVTGDHVFAIMMLFRGCKSTGDPTHAVLTQANAAAGTSATFQDVTTLFDNAMVLNTCSLSLDFGGGAIFSAWTNKAISPVEILDLGTSFNNGGCLGASAGILPIAGASGQTTVTHASSSSRAEITFALIPEAGAKGHYYRQLARMRG